MSLKKTIHTPKICIYIYMYMYIFVYVYIYIYILYIYLYIFGYTKLELRNFAHIYYNLFPTLSLKNHIADGITFSVTSQSL